MSVHLFLLLLFVSFAYFLYARSFVITFIVLMFFLKDIHYFVNMLKIFLNFGKSSYVNRTFVHINRENITELRFNKLNICTRDEH